MTARHCPCLILLFVGVVAPGLFTPSAALAAETVSIDTPKQDDEVTVNQEVNPKGKVDTAFPSNKVYVTTQFEYFDGTDTHIISETGQEFPVTVDPMTGDLKYTGRVMPLRNTLLEKPGGFYVIAVDAWYIDFVDGREVKTHIDHATVRVKLLDQQRY